VKTREKNYPAAINAYEAALELEPASAKVRHAFGNFHLIYLSDSERAVEQFKEGLKIRPNSFHLQSDYVRALFYLKRFEEARVVLDELLSRAPTNRHFSQRIKLADLNLQYYSRRADFSSASGADVKTTLSDLESLIHEFKQIRPEWGRRQDETSIDKEYSQREEVSQRDECRRRTFTSRNRVDGAL
jgi:tetratricopeptide (TPR) repeat protein